MVALYGPILDVHSLGELAMTKLTVLYAVVVALLVLVAGPAGTPAARRRPAAPSCSAAPRSAATRLLTAALLEGAARRPAASGVLAAGRPTSPAACRSTGSPRVRGVLDRHRAGRGRADRAGLPARRQQPHLRRPRGRRDRRPLRAARRRRRRRPAWLSWLSPFGWSTRLRAWPEPRWWVLLLDLGLAAALAGRRGTCLRARRDLGSGVLPARPGPARRAPPARPTRSR